MAYLKLVKSLRRAQQRAWQSLFVDGIANYADLFACWHSESPAQCCALVTRLLASQWKISPAPDSFATTEVAVDRHVLALAALADANHDYTDAKVLQYWVSDIIEHLEALPAPIQMALGLPLFKIGYEHFWWGADQIKHWYQRAMSLPAGTIV
jgi:hypothetical protein